MGGVFVGIPACDDAGAEHVVGEACEAVADGREDGCCVFGAGEGVGVGEELFGQFDA